MINTSFLSDEYYFDRSPIRDSVFLYVKRAYAPKHDIRNPNKKKTPKTIVVLAFAKHIIDKVNRITDLKQMQIDNIIEKYLTNKKSQIIPIPRVTKKPAITAGGDLFKQVFESVPGTEF